MTKSELLANIRCDRAALDRLIESVPPDERSAPVLDDGWSVKDVLAHLCAWEKIATATVRNNRPVDAPPDGDTSTTDAINQKVYEDNRGRPVADIVAEAERSHGALLALVEELSDEQLVSPLGGAAGGPTAGEIISGNSDQHYREHAAWIREQLSL
jgi:uncharacterized protein (TIGR03083 family)